MKTINLIRHADAANGSPDIERPLSALGKHTCNTMASRIFQAGCHFENVFVSTANRTQDTIQIFADALPEQQIKWKTDSALYTFEWPELLNWFESIDEACDEIVIVGHNPAISELTEFLTGEPMAQVPPCTYIKIHAYLGKWTDLYRECGQLIECVYPATR